MNGASVACDATSEALQQHSSATSLRSADAATKAMDARSGPSVDPGNENDPLTQDHPQQDIVESVHESQVSDTHNGLEEQDQHGEDPKDDVIIPDHELLNEKKEIKIDRQVDIDDRGLDESRLNQRRERGIKYAKTTAIYVEGLETRVGWLEKEIVELQYKIGSRARPDDERQVERKIASLSNSTPTC